MENSNNIDSKMNTEKDNQLLKNYDLKNSIEDGDDEDDNKQRKMSNQSSKTPILDTYSRDLTKMAEDNKLDPIVGRIKEIERVSQILSRRKKNNPILIGEAGCVDGETLISVRKISDIGHHSIIEN